MAGAIRVVREFSFFVVVWVIVSFFMLFLFRFCRAICFVGGFLVWLLVEEAFGRFGSVS